MPVQVVRATRATLRRHFASRSTSARWRFVQQPGQFHSLGATRRLLAWLRAQLGAGPYEAVLARHAPAAALLLPGRASRLEPEARAAWHALQARPCSHLTHNFVVQSVLFEAWADLLGDLLIQAQAGSAFELHVSDLADLGWEDGALLKTLYRRRDPRLPMLVIGFDPRTLEPTPTQGIVWSMTAFKLASVALDMQALQADAPVTLDDEPPAEAEPSPQVELAWTPDADDLEAQARAALAAAAQPLPDDVSALVLAALRAALAAFGFTSVLELGQELLRRGARLASLERADVHAYVALAAHDRQFVSEGNLALADLIQEQLEAALAHETRPEPRAALLYRLAVVHGRRRKDPGPALAYAEQALALCQQAGLEPQAAAYQEAWARNIRALALVHARRLDEARAETMHAHAVIDALVSPLPAPGPSHVPTALERDLRATHALLAFNTRTLLDWLGASAAESTRWLARSQAAVRELPGMVRFEALHWVDQHRRAGRLDLAFELARRGGEAAREAGDVLREYEHALHAVECAALLGLVDDLRSLAAGLQALRARCGLAPLRAVDLLVARACQHAGRLDEARQRFEALLSAPEAQDADRRAALLARLACVEAQAGRDEAARARLQEAVDLALATGERDTLLRVNVAAGRVLQRFGHTSQARHAFGEALAMAEIQGTPPSTPTPGDVLAALLGLMDCGGATPELLTRARALAESAPDDPDTAWQNNHLQALERRANREAP